MPKIDSPTASLSLRLRLRKKAMTAKEARLKMEDNLEKAYQLELQLAIRRAEVELSRGTSARETLTIMKTMFEAQFEADASDPT